MSMHLSFCIFCSTILLESFLEFFHPPPYGIHLAPQWSHALDLLLGVAEAVSRLA
jgi:hypothetical protein